MWQVEGLAASLGVSIHGPPPAKHFKEDKSDFGLNGPMLTLAKYSGMNFSGLIHQYKVERKFRNKIACDEYFDLVKLFKVEDTRIETPFVTNLQDSGLLTVNVPKSALPKTKGDVISLLYAFGQYYLQVYPGKAAAFLEYFAYLTSYSSEFTVQGLLKLDSEIRRLYMLNPTWNWEQSRYEVSCITDRDICEKNALLAQVQAKGSFKQNKQSSGRGRGKRRSFGQSHQASPNNTVPSSKRCINHNKGYCKLGSKCFRLHVSFICGNKNHKAFSCPQLLAANLPASS